MWKWKKNTKRLLALTLTVALGISAVVAMAESVTPAGNSYGFAGTNARYYPDYMTLEEEQQIAKELAIEVAGEGFVLLKNENDVLPLDQGGKVSLFGMHSVALIQSTSGSAGGSTGANDIAESTLQMAMENAGFKVNAKLVDLYTKHNTLGTTANELSLDHYSPATVSSYNGYHDAAVIVFSRRGSEGGDKLVGNVADHSDPTDHELMLDDHEKALVKHVKEYYADKPIIVLLNASNILQIPELAEPKATSEYGVDAIFWVGNTGNNAIEAIGQLISGEVSPSGHTVEVWERDFTQGPSITNFGNQTQNVDENGNSMDAFYYYEGQPTKYATIEYREGIYVGYKYYETAADDMNAETPGTGDAWYDTQVLYPFGFGLSYTTFDWALVPAAETVIGDPFQMMSMQVTVTNTGSVAGKDVVQVYVSPPYTQGGIEKASANLVGFAKTKRLAPGESDTVTIEWVAQDMASYDWNDKNDNDFIGYELEEGGYVLSARRNSHEVVLTENYAVSSGLLCTTDYTTGNEITALFVDDYVSVNDSLIGGMISRADGLAQPAPASVADRTIDTDTLAVLDAQYSYRSYMDQGYEDWFVNEDGLPATWQQATSRAEGEKAEISILDMAGVDFSLKIEEGAVAQGSDEGSAKWEAFMNQLTWEEMCSLVDNGGGAEAIESVDVFGAGASETPLQLAGGTLWACPPILAATFNIELAEEVGVMMGNEALFKGCSYWQGNAMNIHRSPLSGRNVEYYSQDGVHNGLFAAAVVQGVTSKGVTCHIKHMMLNDQETYRDLNGGVSTWATEQVIREIYAKPFEYALKSGNSTGVMSSFNRIGMINAQLNGAMHRMVREEWGNRAIFETDAWQGTYCPLDLMVRQGDNQVLGSGSTLPDIGLEVGAWDAQSNCVRVSDGGDGTFLSQTHYAAVRRSAQEMLWNYANSSAIKNGYIGFEPCELAFDSYAVQSKAVSFGDVDFSSVTLAEEAELPAGLTMENAVITSDGTLAEGEWTIPIQVNGIDGYISLSAEVIIQVQDAIHVSDTHLKVGEAADLTIDAPYYAYEGLVAVNERFVSTVAYADGSPLSAGEMEGFGGTTTLPGTGDSVGGTLRIQNWYWVDENQVQGNNYDGLGALAYADSESTDTRYIEMADVEAGSYYQAYLYEFRISDADREKLAEYGLAAGQIMTPVTAHQGISYDVNSALQLSGTPTKAGEVEITVSLQVPLVRGFGARFPNNVHVGSPTATEVTRTFTLTIAE